jgi:hypothetical protein
VYNQVLAVPKSIAISCVNQLKVPFFEKEIDLKIVACKIVGNNPK